MASHPAFDKIGFNPFDPIQDTESGCSLLIGACLRSFNPFDPIQDTESNFTGHDDLPEACFNPFDPIQDTESEFRARVQAISWNVSTHSIRYRILKVSNHLAALNSASMFQPIRSDTGY